MRMPKYAPANAGGTAMNKAKTIWSGHKLWGARARAKSMMISKIIAVIKPKVTADAHFAAPCGCQMPMPIAGEKRPLHQIK